MNVEDLSNKIDALTREIRELRNEVQAIKNLLESPRKKYSWSNIDPSKLDKKTRDKTKLI